MFIVKGELIGILMIQGGELGDVATAWLCSSVLEGASRRPQNITRAAGSR